MPSIQRRGQLPVPHSDNWDWQRKGSCRGRSADAFYHPDGERGAARAARVKRAKAICEQCPVITQCRQHALQVREPFGTWGGLSEVERRALANKRGRRHGG